MQLPFWSTKVVTIHKAAAWYPQTTRQRVAKRIVQQHDAGQNHSERIRGWYDLAGGGAGFLLVESDDASA